jgi:NAD(P)-dependent dehydrogenase (short-subunit alcohol dehydrogenase family)
MADPRPIALVTGGAGNLGRAVAQVLAGRGWAVVAIDRQEGPLAEVTATLPGTGHGHIAGVDLADAGACDAAVAEVVRRHGRIDAVVHTVGGFAGAPIAEGGAALFEAMFRINVLTTANLFRAAAVAMRPAGAAPSSRWARSRRCARHRASRPIRRRSPACCAWWRVSRRS